MTKLLSLIAAGSLVVLVGCNKEGSSTAAPKPGHNPDAVRKLTVKSPGDQSVTRDQTDEMTVSVDRDNFAGPVQIEVKNLPPGVSLVTTDMTIPAGKDSLTVTVKAAADAPVVEDHKAQVTARAEDQKDMKEAAVDFTIDVKARK